MVLTWAFTPIYDTVTPNHSSILHLCDVYTSTVHNEFTAGRYVGPFSRTQLEAELGPFPDLPLILPPKDI